MSDHEVHELNVRTLFGEVWRRLGLIFDNHYFMFVFFVMVIMLGSVSIWYSAVFDSGDGRIDRLIINMSTLNLMAFSAPLLATTIFDKTMGMITSRDSKDASVAVRLWLTLATSVTILLIVVLYGIGASYGANFSWFSFFAWLLSILYWAIANIENPNYSIPSDGKFASGGNNVGSASQLKRG
ncbi:hypothetical protein ACK356_13080 [Aeromonas veronii]|uniref:hypothetical protein n=1 Tax=Aeromonas TaxID=642 RepID=UPI0038CF2CA1